MSSHKIVELRLRKENCRSISSIMEWISPHKNALISEVWIMHITSCAFWCVSNQAPHWTKQYVKIKPVDQTYKITIIITITKRSSIRLPLLYDTNIWNCISVSAKLIDNKLEFCDLHVNTKRNEIANKNSISKCCEFTILFMNVYHLDKKNWHLQ